MERLAGDFGSWLQEMRAVLRGRRGADVPCGDCVGCCVSSYPIPLRPHDAVALERVPASLLSLPVAGGLARMLPLPDGTCPMLEAGRCAIYAQRPQTCRDYDCRIYAAAGLEPDGERPVIRQRVREWRFTFADDTERARAGAVRRAATFIRDNAGLFPPAARAHSATAAAVLAVKVYPLFIDRSSAPPEELVRAMLKAARAFDAEEEVAGAFDRDCP